jgi:hypothetical protein
MRVFGMFPKLVKQMDAFIPMGVFTHLLKRNDIGTDLFEMSQPSRGGRTPSLKIASTSTMPNRQATAPLYMTRKI